MTISITKAFTESVLEEAALGWLIEPDNAALHGPKLATLRVGDAVKVTGRINQEQNGQLVNLDDCEFKE